MGGMGKRIFSPTPPKMHQNASFSYSKYKNFSAGRGTPLPAPHPLCAFGASILAPSVLDEAPRKILGTDLKSATNYDDNTVVFPFVVPFLRGNVTGSALALALLYEP
jgi:hypothetical protein